MTRRLGGNGRNGLAVLAALSLAATLATGGTMVGCGSSSSSGPPATVDSGIGGEGGIHDGSTEGSAEAAPPDSGPDTSTTLEGGPDAPVQPTAATPTCSPTPGAFTTPQSVTISDTTPGAQILFTVDGTNPNANSQVFTSPLSLSSTTQIRAQATATGFAPSAVASCPYTITITTVVTPPTAAPAAGAYNNDFPATLTTPTAGATICFTLDGSMPVCTNGACVSPSQTYSAATRIPINGSVTGNPAIGEVVLNALACEAGQAVASMAPVTYTLQVAPPTFNGPGPLPNVVPFTSGGFISPTVASLTDGATGLYTASANNLPTCSNGLPLGTLPSTFVGGTTGVHLSENAGNQTAYAVACKAGYVPSTMTTAAYSIMLNTPAPTIPAGIYNAIEPVAINDTLNNAAVGEYTCVTLDGTTPACSATACGGTGTKLGASGGTDAITFPSNKRTPATGLNATGTAVAAVACSPSFASSTAFGPGAYTLALDPVAFQCSTISAVAGFAACNSATVPNAGSVWVQASEDVVVPGDEAYDYTCNSTDGTTPNCACNTTAPSTLVKCSVGDATAACAGTTFTTGALTAASLTNGSAKIQSIGCISPTSTPNGVEGDAFVDTAVAALSVHGTNVVSTPNIEPSNPSIANPQAITFQNTEVAGGASTFFCYTVTNTSNTPPVLNGVSCFGPGITSGSTTCTSAVTAPGATSTDGPTVSITGTFVQAIACDASNAKAPSGLATPVQYQLVVGTPTIVQKGAVEFGESVTIHSATVGATIQYSTNGTTPDCTAAFSALNAVTDAKGNAIYFAMGKEIAPLTVIGCKTGYTVSAGTDTTTFTYSAAAPVALYADGATNVAATTGMTFDDYVQISLEEPPATGGGTDGLWFCTGPAVNNPGCSQVTADACTGTGATPSATCAVAFNADILNSLGQPTAAPNCIQNAAIVLPSGPAPQSTVACVPPIGKITATSVSNGTSLDYKFQASQVEMTSSGTMTGPGPVTFDGTLSVTPPDGDATHPGSTNGALTAADFICASSTQTIASLGGQPASCAGFVAGVHTGWSCMTAVATGLPSVPPAVGPTLSILDQGENASYAAFDCKDGMTWSTGASFPVTFAPYVHKPAFVATGATSDFLTGAAGPTIANPNPGAGENLAGADGATAYVTFDATNLYVGFDRGVAYGATDIVHFYIGSSGLGATKPDDNNVAAGSVGDERDLPTGFNALFHVFWRLDNSFTNTADKWNGTGWVSDGAIATIKYNLASTFVEFTIPLASLPGITNKDYHLLGADWLGGPGDVGAWPAPQNADTGSWAGWQSEVLTAAWFPNDTNLTDLE
jgi:hypothetical protein